MKAFLIKTILFSLFLLFYFGINSLINFLIYSNAEPELHDSNILIIGDSHPQRSLDPGLLHDAQNVSQSAEPMILSYWKADFLLSEADIDTLIIGFGHHNLSAYNDLKFTTDQWSFEMFKRSYPIEHLESIEKNVEIDYLDYYKTLWKETAFYPKTDHFHFIGNFKNSLESDVSDSSITANRHYFKGDEVVGFSETSISHLFLLIKLCNSMKIKPILIISPVHASYLSEIPIEFKNKFNEILYSLETQGVLVIDKAHVQYPDSLFYNSTHLNRAGAARFTKEVKQYLRKTHMN